MNKYRKSLKEVEVIMAKVRSTLEDPTDRNHNYHIMGNIKEVFEKIGILEHRNTVNLVMPKVYAIDIDDRIENVELFHFDFDSTEELLKRAVNHFGGEMQIIIMMEEMAELIQALSKRLRGDDSNINEEMADVEIMLSQMKLYLGNTEEVKTIKEEKLKRLKERLDNLEASNYDATQTSSN